jgi:hypothetical protein
MQARPQGSAFELSRSPPNHMRGEGHPPGGGFGSIVARILTVKLPENCEWESSIANGNARTAALDRHGPVGTAHIRLDATMLGQHEHLLHPELEPAERLLLEAALSEAVGDLRASSQQFADVSQRNSRLAAALIVAGHAATQRLNAHHHALTLLVLVRTSACAEACTLVCW